MAPGPRLQELTAKYMQNPRRFFVPLANEYRKLNELDRAIALCREHLPSQPGHMSGHIVLGRAYFEKGDIEAAREVFMTSVALDDENLIALRHLGDIARLRDELIEARQWYIRVLDADPQNEDVERIVSGLRLPDGDVTTAPPVARRETLFPATDDPGPVPDEHSAGDSALFDPTPPGLRAITAPTAADLAAVTSTALPPVPSRPLNTFDLSTLDAPLTGVTPPAGIEVDDGVSFIFEDASALQDPSAFAFGDGPSLPPVAEADFSAGVQTPTQSSETVPSAESDPLLTRPALGALASFASWRSAQDRDTPTQQSAPPVIPAEPDASLQDAVPPAASDSLFRESGATDAAPTAPEFVTETMAALYAQQGFPQQALDVYRELASRSPWDASLHERVAGLEKALSGSSVDKMLQDDADKALRFGELDDDASSESQPRSMLEAMYDDSTPSTEDEALEGAFGGVWSAAGDRTTAEKDDWFADDPGPAAAMDSGIASEGMFGIATDAFGQPAIPIAGRDTDSGIAIPERSGASLDAVFGTASISAADETASEMLIALAGQMVGRLPKEAPTLPVPDILELPSSVPANETTGASPAPLLSFDRFFSGSGAPPRQRIDTPATRSSTPAWPPTPAPASPPSLSPTFGGVPVIPPPPAAVTPSSWASFDQFVPPTRPPAAALTSPPTVPTPQASALPSTVPPALVPPRPIVPPRRVAPIPQPGSHPPYPSFSGLSLDEVAPPAPTEQESVPDAPKPAASSGDDAGDAAPSEFHRWLEGLS